jgi:hypothetical protein
VGLGGTWRYAKPDGGGNGIASPVFLFSDRGGAMHGTHALRPLRGVGWAKRAHDGGYGGGMIPAAISN